MPVEEESSYLTTFLLPRGRFRYLRGPMGLLPTGDEWCLRSDAVIEGDEHSQKIVDDIITEAEDYLQPWQRVKRVLTKCREMRITISVKRLGCGDRITFAGYSIGHDGIKPDPERTKAIRDFPIPKNV